MGLETAAEPDHDIRNRSDPWFGIGSRAPESPLEAYFHGELVGLRTDTVIVCRCCAALFRSLGGREREAMGMTSQNGFNTVTPMQREAHANTHAHREAPQRQDVARN